MVISSILGAGQVYMRGVSPESSIATSPRPQSTPNMPSPPLFARPPFPVSPDGALSQFRIAVPEDDVQRLKTLLELLPIARPNWENGHNDRVFGTPRDWLADSVEYWKNTFDW